MKQLLATSAARRLLTVELLRQATSTLLELTAVALIALVVAVAAAPVWALIPVAVYCLIVSISLGRPAAPRTE